MPRICEFLGIVIYMYFNDTDRHHGAHFHAQYGEFEVSVGIAPVQKLEGDLPSKKLGQLLGWATLHQDELLTDWKLVVSHQAPKPIAPLQK